MEKKLICAADDVGVTAIPKGSRSPVRCLSYFILVCLILGTSTCQNKTSDSRAQYTEQEAGAFIDDYIQVLSDGDSARVLSFWSPRSVEDSGFWYMHAARGLRLPFSRWPDFLEIYRPEIHDVLQREDHTVVDLAWVPRDTTAAPSAQPRDMRFYVVQEGGRRVLINPIDILTQDWNSYESDYLTYHFPEEYLPADYMLEIMANDR